MYINVYVFNQPMQFKVENQKIKPIMQVLKDNIDQGFLQVDNSGVKVLTADKANTTMFSIHIKPEFFESFNVDKKEHMQYYDRERDSMLIGLQIANIYPVLRKFSKSDTLVFSLEPPKFKISKDRDSISLPTLDLDTKEQIIDPKNISLPSKFNIEATDFTDKVSLLSVYDGVVVESRLKEDSFIMSANSSVGSTHTKTDIKNFQGKEVTAYFQDHLLENLSKAIKKLSSKEDILEMRLGNQMPLEVLLERENLILSLYLAPRIKED